MKKATRAACCIGFGYVVLSRISWLSDSSCAMRYDSDIHRGVWAGDRFDITTIDQIRSADEGGEWRDVSDEVAQEMIAIWVCEYGEEWLEQKVRMSCVIFPETRS